MVMRLNILYEDEYILALDKPSGLMVHGDGRTEEDTLTDWINSNYPALSDIGEPMILQRGKETLEVKRPGIVHRLDKETSGVILVAKTKESHQFLKEQFQKRLVKKVYNAVVWGKFGEENLEGVVDKPIGKSPADFRRWSAEYGAKGELREAVTEYKVLTQGEFEGEKFAYLEIRPKTGRTHQIRVHMKSISHPVVMDKLYGSKNSLEKQTLGFKRLALHALSISLVLPNNTHIQIESPLPEEFENAKNLLTTT